MYYQVEIIGRHKLTMYRSAFESHAAKDPKMPDARLLFSCGFKMVAFVSRSLEVQGFANTQNRARSEMPN
jgi:hypothetical protein